MRKIRIEKLVLNICIGDGADRLTRAATVLRELTDQEPVFSKGKFHRHCYHHHHRHRYHYLQPATLFVPSVSEGTRRFLHT